TYPVCAAAQAAGWQELQTAFIRHVSPLVVATYPALLDWLQARRDEVAALVSQQAKQFGTSTDAARIPILSIEHAIENLSNGLRTAQRLIDGTWKPTGHQADLHAVPIPLEALLK
ncbi:MAG: hypothetical protein ACREIC_20900, partial [Limisphaerales bacterium]